MQFKFTLIEKDYIKKTESSFSSENQVIQKSLIDLLNVNHGDCVLDLGCGWGASFTILLDRVGTIGKVIGYDINENFLAQSERLFQEAIKNKNLELYLGKSGEPLPFPNNYFDKIMCHNVIESAIDKSFFLSEAYRMLKPDGAFLLSHIDFDTAVYNSAYKDLTRKLVHNFCDFTQGWQETSDGQIGRKLRSLISHSPFKKFNTHTFVITEENYTEHKYGYRYSEWTIESAKASRIFSNNELEDWISELIKLDKDKGYYFSISLMTILACK